MDSTDLPAINARSESQVAQPDIHRDTLLRRLYANDASMYEEQPEGVFFPQNGDDIRDLVKWCAVHRTPITARAAGTSLAGQTTGGGVVMDTSRHMSRILEIRPAEGRATVQPGVIRDTLNREAAVHGLQFGPDTSTTNRCMLGGMIGNNSAGSFSLKHRTTREHVQTMRVVLSDGSLAEFGPLTNEELETRKQRKTLEGRIYREMLALLEANKDAILDSYPHPDITRRNTGYALDRLCEMEPLNPGGRPFNMAELLCGSEGTLAMTVDADVRLVPLPKHKILLIGQYTTLRESMLATVEAVKAVPPPAVGETREDGELGAVELIDDIIIKATELNLEQSRNRFFIVGEPKAVLIMQLEGGDADKLVARAKALGEQLKADGLGYDYQIFTQPEDMHKVWELRKAGLGLLMGTWAESRTPEFIEDTSVRVEDLPAYIEEFEAIMRRYDTHSVYYAHASVGELHLRPELNLTTREGFEKMKQIAVDVARLVKKYRGSLSGEHGDGRVRAPYIELVLGTEMMPLLRQVKQIWDPNGIFNPGKIVDPKPMDADLRFYPEEEIPTFNTVFHYRNEGNFMALVDKCNGAGVCRKLAESGGTMCPSYMATRDEKDSTRGRANVFRQVFRGERYDAFSNDDLHDALSLCLSCKACKTECPANVDMAKMKAEFTQGRHDRAGAPLSYHFFGRPELFYPLAAPFSGLVNWMNRLNPVKEIYKTLFNIHPDRNLPEFSAQTFQQWFRKRQPKPDSGSQNPGATSPGAHTSGFQTVTEVGSRHVTGSQAAGKQARKGTPIRGKVLIMVDVFMNYNEPEVGRAMVHVLEHLGYEVLVTQPLASGRTQLSKGFVRDARSIAHKNIGLLTPYASEGIPIIGQEPSEILSLRDEYLDLCDDDRLDGARKVAASAYLFEEFLQKHFAAFPEDANRFDARGRQAVVHGHCHAKALVGMEPVMEVLEKIGYQAENLPTGCCGMAGSFGYENEHFEISQQIGEMVLFPRLRSTPEETEICAHGFSCRHQIADGVDRTAHHTAVLVRNAMKPG
ncbi:MAG: FAD/FMN dehdrogenase with 4Fe4S domain [Bacteroidetes bacterium HLUCCA01]|nr:MAG: FAD/FMN dehdrogenase with 4Fe4S domain [Bacteroidetes bacterium HLUCCA01]